MKAKIVILGVNHAYQLVSKACQPAVYRAFFDLVKPDGIGIERAPEHFVRGDYYEFTYEQQQIAVPYALERGIQLHPFDWMMRWSGALDAAASRYENEVNLYNSGLCRQYIWLLVC